MPNFRGSTGYGKKFLNAGNRQWGEKMQDDVTWGVKYLVSQGIADPKRVGIMGGSYGGYATLAGVAFTPDLYAAAVDIVGPSNLITLLDSIPPYWEAGRIIFHERMGNPKTPEGRARLEQQSPLNSAQKIKTPLLVAQGANDPRVKKAEAEQIVIALRDRGFPVEYILAPDEGHGFQRPVNSMALWAASEKFFAKHIGGRVAAGRDARGRRAPRGDHGRPEDGRAHEEGGRRGGRPAEGRRQPDGRERELPGEGRGQRADDADVADARGEGGGRRLADRGDGADADGPRVGRGRARQGEPRRCASAR